MGHLFSGVGDVQDHKIFADSWAVVACRARDPDKLHRPVPSAIVFPPHHRPHPCSSAGQ